MKYQDYVCVGDSISRELNGVTYTASIVADPESNPSDYECYSKANIRAWRADEWQYVGVVVGAENGGWTKEHISSLWSIEANIPEVKCSEHLSQVANKLIEDAALLVGLLNEDYACFR